MLIAVGNPRTGADAFGALGLAHLEWRTWFSALGLATLGWQPWFGSLPRGDLGLAALRDGTQGHGILGDGNQSLAFLVDILAGTPCRHRTSIWHTAGWRTWFGALGRGALRRGDLGCAARAKGSGNVRPRLGLRSLAHSSLAHWLASHGATLLPRSPGTLNRKTSPAGLIGGWHEVSHADHSGRGGIFPQRPLPEPPVCGCLAFFHSVHSCTA